MATQAQPKKFWMLPLHLFAGVVGSIAQRTERFLRQLFYWLALCLVLAAWVLLAALILMPIGKVIADYWAPAYWTVMKGKPLFDPAVPAVKAKGAK